MRTLCVQFHTRRARGLSTAVVSRLMIEIAVGSAAVRDFSMRRRGSYVNYCFEGPAVRPMWRVVRREAIASRRVGRKLRASTIIVAQGSQGWLNYLLLHHFDPGQRLDYLDTEAR